LSADRRDFMQTVFQSLVIKMGRLPVPARGH
jgi:hypothetical protein